MTEKLVIYAYNVRFGDAILVEAPEGAEKRYMLIDVGNALAGEGGIDRLLLDTLEDIHQRTKGKIDLYVMTHEHLDHMQGLLLAGHKGCKFEIDTVWMPAMSEKGYYTKNTKAREKRAALWDSADAFMKMTGASRLSDELKLLMALNARSSDEYVNYIRSCGKNVQYLSRGDDVNGRHILGDSVFRILAPEKDSSVYYHRLPRFNFGCEGDSQGASAKRPLPLPGIDGRAFFGLIDGMDKNQSESLYMIDKAGNNTSLVIEMTWRNRRLLFSGDAEQESWQYILKNSKAESTPIPGKRVELKPVDFFKIGHHGSSNARPPKEVLEKILPMERKNKAVALLSTYPAPGSREKEVYAGVPDAKTIDIIKARTKTVYDTTAMPEGKPVTIVLTGGR